MEALNTKEQLLDEISSDIINATGLENLVLYTTYIRTKICPCNHKNLGVDLYRFFNVLVHRKELLSRIIKKLTDSGIVCGTEKIELWKNNKCDKCEKNAHWFDIHYR